uniref:NADH dehydrogenase subunit 2 n=1 Tax=Brachytarsina amboinensis TaxID=3018683 RepID=UPI0023AB130C|nr:NADH dehydrogenase subunit 2 [Brachytarsina amboinensis]WCL18784.1 NADH dehydrogenase subunit 2 [Brachytarsina amboinensis]
MMLMFSFTMIIFSNMMMISSLMMKLGSAPFHYWFIDVMENISWNNNLILMTWQKLAPLILISYMMNKIIIIYIILSLMISTIKGINQTSIRKLMAYSSVNNLSWMLSSMNNHKLMMIYFLIYSLMSFFFLSVLVLFYSILLLLLLLIIIIISTIKGINQTSIRKLMAYSSVNNLSWMLSSMNNHKLMMIYFLIYSLMSFSLIMIFNMLKISHMNQLFMMMNNKSMKIFIMLNTISMAGMPPFLGFIPKWLVIQELIFFNNYFLSWMLMMSSLIMIYLYLRLYYMTLLLNNHKLMIFNKNYYNNNYLMSIMLLSIINFLSLLMIPLYFNF